MRATLTRIFLETLERCAADRLVRDLIEPRAGNSGFAIPTSRFDVKIPPEQGRLWVFGAGKAALSMAKGAVEKLEEQIHGGVLIVPDGVSPEIRSLGPVEVRRGRHPHPNESSVKATKRLLEVAAQCGPNDHALFLLSGGTSALLAQPLPGISIEQKAALLGELMRAGAPIEELNTVRKHLSLVKGGKLASFFPCGLTVLVLSDVAGNSFETVGSGPLIPTNSTPADALAILDRRLKSKGLPPKVVRLLMESAFLSAGKKKKRETTSEGSSSGARPLRHVLVGDGQLLARTAAHIARKKHGLNAEFDAIPVVGDVTRVADAYAAVVLNRQGGPRLQVRYGEPVVNMHGRTSGEGGRNQQLALRVAERLASHGTLAPWAFLSAGSDGVDGNSAAAGGVVDERIWEEALTLGLDPAGALERFDTASVLKALNCQVNSGPSGTNLQDLHLLFLR